MATPKIEAIFKGWDNIMRDSATTTDDLLQQMMQLVSTQHARMLNPWRFKPMPWKFHFFFGKL